MRKDSLQVFLTPVCYVSLPRSYDCAWLSRLLDFSLSFRPSRRGRWPLRTAGVCVRKPHRGASVRPRSGCIGRLRTRRHEWVSRGGTSPPLPPSSGLQPPDNIGWLEFMKPNEEIRFLFFPFLKFYRNWCGCCAVKHTPFVTFYQESIMYETRSGHTN